MERETGIEDRNEILSVEKVKVKLCTSLIEAFAYEVRKLDDSFTQLPKFPKFDDSLIQAPEYAVCKTPGCLGRIPGTGLHNFSFLIENLRYLSPLSFLPEKEERRSAHQAYEKELNAFKKYPVPKFDGSFIQPRIYFFLWWSSRTEKEERKILDQAHEELVSESNDYFTEPSFRPSFCRETAQPRKLNNKDEAAPLPTFCEGKVKGLYPLSSPEFHPTMQIEAFAREKTFQVLIDSGSNLNFISERIAEELGLTLVPVKGFSITVANDCKVRVAYKCENVLWMTQGFLFEAPFYVIPMQSNDAILGIEWLRTLGDIKFNFDHLTMQFQQPLDIKRTVCLRSDHPDAKRQGTSTTRVEEVSRIRGKQGRKIREEADHPQGTSTKIPEETSRARGEQGRKTWEKAGHPGKRQGSSTTASEDRARGKQSRKT